MIDIRTALQNVLRAVYGKDVRQSIHDAIFQINENANEAIDLAQIKFGNLVTDPTSPVIDPSTTLPFVEGAIYFNTTTGIMWKLSGGAWDKLGTLRAIENNSLIGTSGLVDTYRWTFNDGTYKDYSVTNGADGVSVVNVTKIGSTGKIDHYEVNLSDGSTTPTGIDVTNGEDGKSIVDTRLVSQSGRTKNYVFELSDGSTTPNGITVEDGEADNLYLRFSAQFDGTGMVSTPSSATEYIGICVTKQTIAPTNPAAYMWVKFIGSSGSGTGDMLASDYAAKYPKTVDRAAALYDGIKEILANQLMQIADYANNGNMGVVDKAAVLVDVLNGKIADTEVLAKLGVDASGNLVYDGKPIIGGASGGSILHVHTRDFIGMTVTVTDSDPDTGEIETLTSTFDATGLATFHVTGSGIAEVSVTDTDGKVYKSSVNMTYYGIYTVSVNRFSATINVTVESGATVTATDGTNTYSATSNGVAVITVGNTGTFTILATKDGVTSADTKAVSIAVDGETKNTSIAFASITLSFTGSLVANVSNATFSKSISDSTGNVKIYVPGTGDYTITGTLDGDDINPTTAKVTGYTNINVDIKAGSNYYEDWLAAGGFTTATYPTLADLFTEDSAGVNEKAVRKLMTVHASVDILCDWITEEPTAFDDFLSSRLAMKWIGLRDYVCDKLIAISGIATKLINNETEFTLSDGTTKKAWEYILKDKVPVMTSNTAPYGEAKASSEFNANNAAYKAFDDSTSTWWSSTGGAATNAILQYKFTNPICVKRVHLLNIGANTINWQVVASNDGTNWNNVGEQITVVAGTPQDVTLDNNDYYLYWGIKCINSSDSYVNIYTLQFYGRSLNVSVPVMTSNEDIYGKASGSAPINNDYTYFKAFDSDLSVSRYASADGSTSGGIFISYKFQKPVQIKQVDAILYGDVGDINLSIEASKDGEIWEPTNEFKATFTALNVPTPIPTQHIETDEKYQYWRLLKKSSTKSMRLACSYLNFYGVDYSEREFEDGSTMRYIYDNGVELISLTKSATSVLANVDIQTTDKLLRATVGSHATTSDKIKCGTGSATLTSEMMPNNCYLDISSINGTQETGFSQVADTTDISCWIE